MAQTFYTLTREGYEAIREMDNAKQTGVMKVIPPEANIPREVRQAAESLMLQVPDLSWTIELNVLGNHRITIHFKGADIGIDE